MDLLFQHTSMQFSDSRSQMQSDAERLFSRDAHVCTGSEAGNNPLRVILPEVARDHGYRIHLGASDWVAVKRDLVKGDWESGNVHVIESTQGSGQHGDRGISWVGFEAEFNLGHLTVGAGHLLTEGRSPGDPNYHLNVLMARAIERWAERHGHGGGVVFYGGDQNSGDERNDTFIGAPLTSGWDALNHYEKTGKRLTIDVIATYDGDKRVQWKSIRALDDSEFHLFTDHNLVEGVVSVKQARRR